MEIDFPTFTQAGAAADQLVAHLRQDKTLPPDRLQRAAWIVLGYALVQPPPPAGGRRKQRKVPTTAAAQANLLEQVFASEPEPVPTGPDVAPAAAEPRADVLAELALKLLERGRKSKPTAGGSA
jgi:hypothetical protein